MKKKFLGSQISELLMGVVLICILLSFLTFSSLTMPMNLAVFAITILVVIFLGYASTVWKETARDEREEHHRLQASRLGYLVGASLLILAAITQLFTHELDAWIIYVLVGMILSKIATRVYFRIFS